MRHIILLSPLAKNDLFAIAEYTMQKWGNNQADIYLDKIDKALLKIQDNPNIGRVRSDISDRHRSFLMEKHLLVYTVEDTEIIISRILHHSRDIKSIIS
jgi:toxin ParE1/3/4